MATLRFLPNRVRTLSTCDPLGLPLARDRSQPNDDGCGARMRIETARLALTSVGTEHATDLSLVHSDPDVAYWSDAWSPEQAAAAAAEMARQ